MSKPANVHAFFAKLASALGSSNEQPSLKMLHSVNAECQDYITGSLQNILAQAIAQPKLFAKELKDYGVGLPPLAHG
jgi:hypothetical protein